MARHHAKHAPKPAIKRVEVYPSQDTAMRLRDRLAAERVGIDFIVQKVVTKDGPGFIVRELQMTPAEVRVVAPGPSFKSHADRSAYIEALQDEANYRAAEAQIIHAGRSKEPKSIHADVPVRSISKPKMGSKTKQHEDSAYYRRGSNWKSDHAGWRRLPRID